MKSRVLGCLLAASAMLAIPTTAQAQVLLDQVDLPVQTNSPYTFNFVTGSTSTAVAFGGYDVPSSFQVRDIRLVEFGGSTNLLGAVFGYTPAACGPLAGQGGVGAFGTNDLGFGGLCTGSYDIFSQSFASLIGSTYTLSFLVNNGTLGSDGLRVTASDTRQVAAVPEPASWAMMLFGFGAMSVVVRRQRRRPGRLQAV